MSSENNDIGAIALILLLLGGLGVLGWQVYEYLRLGVWTPISIITALEWMQVQWAYSPNDWVGLHNILEKMPLSMAMFTPALFGIVIANQN
jgi:hypothetical protein